MELSNSLDLNMDEVILKGGAPWGFSLAGGSEKRTSLIVDHVDEGGKADGILLPGDRIAAVNDVACASQTEALQLIHSAFKTLTVKVERRSLTLKEKLDLAVLNDGETILTQGYEITQNLILQRHINACKKEKLNILYNCIKSLEFLP
ncbi:unnamed protein product [Owenia fusiformis]|uniref:Uncharacterized protein n=1 Tax=Owenia fusiformis TaxID=6347 RepID=A0A8J1XLK6_OWEFU|nr:unnamed protein product [Owenia fusiformis]